MKIWIAQINTTIGDFAGNVRRILGAATAAEAVGADVCLFPELSICGYPPRDLLELPAFLHRSKQSLEQVVAASKNTALVIGCPWPNTDPHGRALYNAAVVAQHGKILGWQGKGLLPHYDVFDEARHFEPATHFRPIEINGKRVAIAICEDIWNDPHVLSGRSYRLDPLEEYESMGVDVMLNLSASPFTTEKSTQRAQLVSGVARRLQAPVVYCNQVGGNDELVFDGGSFVADSNGRIVCALHHFVEEQRCVDLARLPTAEVQLNAPSEEHILSALRLGLADYARKCHFTTALVGLSGGIDSALVAAIACDALGAKNVTGVLLPSPYTSQQSIDDAFELARRLGIRTEVYSISDLYERMRRVLGYPKNDHISITDENIQARLRGNLLMSLSNDRHALLLSTGNKSEMAVGYCTLYGDMAGGLAVISDMFKTTVYALARHLQKTRGVIPQSILDRPPTAELRPNQTDQQSLPPYEILDGILLEYIVLHRSPEEIASIGYDRKIVDDIVARVNRNEYKRRQAPPGLKMSSKAFGSGRRFPIACKI